ncbi:hypothetical protein [Kitasatospora sp. NPDC093806]|uniref:hypothetical protein n=1 Tax=Kitasatospora sp. NPDC093806 TaxID=3155075 RepID=UPI003421EE53
MRNPICRDRISGHDLARRLLAPPSGQRRHEVRGLRVTGSLDLAQARVEHPVALIDCVFEEIVLTEASFPQLSLVDCRVGTAEPWNGELKACHLSITGGDLHLDRFQGVIDLGGAHIRDDLHLEGARLSAKAGETHSLRAANLRIGGNLCIGNSQDVAHERPAPGDRDGGRFEAAGTILLEDARIDGSAYFNGAAIGRAEAEPQYAVSGDGMVVGGSFYGSGLETHGQLRLVGATIGGACEFHGTRVHRSDANARPGEGAVMLDRADIGGSLFCDNGFLCAGTFRAVGLKVSASAVFNGATVTAGGKSDGAALQLDRAVIGRLLLREGTAPDDEVAARVREFRRTPAADGAADQELRFWAEGAVTLTGAQVGQDVHLDVTGIAGTTADLGGTPGGATVIADLARLQTTVLRLSGGTGRRAPEGALIDLTQAKLVVLWDENEVWQKAAGTAGGLHYVLKGLRYEAIHTSGVPFGLRQEWLAESARYVRSATRPGRERASYVRGAPAPQPYDQLAAAYTAAGHDRDAQNILLRKNQEIEHHRRSIARDAPNRRTKLQRMAAGFLPRLWNVIQNVFIGYGYRPGKALLWLLGLWLAAVAVFCVYPPDPYLRQAVVTEETTELPGMNWVEHCTYPADLLIPLVGFGEKERWHPSTDETNFLASFLVVSGWFLGATVLVSVTRVVRRQ